MVFSAYAQEFEYEKIQTNFRGDLKYVDYLPSGFILGVADTPYAAAFSSDNGVSWNYFEKTINSKTLFRESMDAEIFMAVDNDFYKLDTMVGVSRKLDEDRIEVEVTFQGNNAVGLRYPISSNIITKFFQKIDVYLAKKSSK